MIENKAKARRKANKTGKPIWYSTGNGGGWWVHPSKMGAPRKYSGGVKLRAAKVPLTDEEFERVKSISPQERAERLLKPSPSK